LILSLEVSEVSAKSAVVFLVDVYNTLLDNDRITADLKGHLEREVGHEREERYLAIFAAGPLCARPHRDCHVSRS